MLSRILAMVLVVAASAGSSLAQEAGTNSKIPTLFKLRGDACAEDYVAELRSIGIEVAVQEFDKLDGVAKAAGLPKSVIPTHIFFIGGFVVANHAPPAAIIKLLKERPKATGIIGSSSCASAQNHNEIHAANVRVF